MVKLSQQQAIKDQGGDVRLSRSERVRERQTKQRFLLAQAREKTEFERKKSIAQGLQEKEFANIKDLKEYGEKYQTLKPEIKPFFSTPEQLGKARTERIGTTKTTVSERVVFANNKLVEAKQKYTLKIAKMRKYYDEHRDKKDIREWLNREDRDAEDDLEEEEAKWRGYKEGLRQGLGQLNSNKDIPFNEIDSYAWQIADYEENREEARNDKRDFDTSQRKKIAGLIDQGYKPFVIQKSYKGKVEATYLEFHKKETGDWQRIAAFKVPKQISTLKLQKSKLGRVEVQRSLFFAGKEFKFKSNLQLFVDPSGKLSTKFGSIGQNEKQIIKQAQDIAFQDWTKVQKGKPYAADFKILTKTDLPFGYGGQQTVSDQPITSLISKEQYFAQQDKPSLLKIPKTIVNLYGKIPSGRYYYTAAGLSLSKTKGKAIDITSQIEKGGEKLGEINKEIKKWAFGSKGRAKLKELDLELETKYQERYQTAFERKEMKGLIYQEKTFKEATKEFETSKEAKLLQREYQEEYRKKYKQISSDVPILRAGAGGLAMAGVSLGQMGLKAIRTPKSTVTSGVFVYTGLKALKTIPTAVSYAASGGLAIYGTYKFVSPTSTIEERGAGLLTAGVSIGFLGFGAYRSLRSPVVKTVKIKPKFSAKVQKVVAFEKRPIIKTDLLGKVTKIETAVVPKTLSRQIIAGRKTIVTTKGREIIRKSWLELGVKPKFAENYLYKGVPSQQLGKTYKFVSPLAIKSPQSTFIYKTSSGYQKALKKLTRYGYTTSQAKATLKYIAPKIIDTELKAINVLYSGSAIKTPFAKTKTEVITRQPTIEFDTGLKTRGAKTIKDIYRSEKVIVGSFKDKVIIKEASIRSRVFLTDQGAMFNKIRQAGKTTVQYERTILAKTGVIKKGQVIIGGSKDLKLLIAKEYKYQTLKEIFRQRQIIPKQLKVLYGGQKTKLIKTTQDPYFIDERELTGIRAREIFIPTKPPKIKLIKQMSGKELKEMIRDLQKIYGTGKPLPKLKFLKRIAKPSVIINQVDDIAIKSAGGQVSKYYGTGQYERTTGGISPQELKGLDFPQIKIPDVRLKSQIKGIVKLDNFLKLNVASLVGIKSLTDLKTRTDLKSDLKLKIGLKNILKTDLVLKTKQRAALKQAPALKTLLKTKLNIQQVSLSFLSPSIAIPKIPAITPPIFRPKPFFIPILKGKIKKKLKKKKKQIQEFAFLPDFTAKALGLKPEILTGKQAQARVRKILTGFEIRRPIKIK